MKKKVNYDIGFAIKCGIKNAPAILINGTIYERPIKFDKLMNAINTVLKTYG